MSGEPAHRGGFVNRNSDQAPVKKDALQVSGSMADLESPGPFDKGNYFHDPVFPMTKRNKCRDEIVGEGELVIQEMEEDTEKKAHRV
jgi:hypothetical protein